MAMKMTKDSTAAMERAIKKSQKEKYVLKLYVTGFTPKSTRAITNVKKICEEHLKGRYDLEVIDIYEHRVLAKGEEIIAVPTLIRKLPPPVKKIIGDLANKERVLLGLNILPKDEEEKNHEKESEEEKSVNRR